MDVNFFFFSFRIILNTEGYQVFAESLLGDECFKLADSRLEILAEKCGYRYSAIAVHDKSCFKLCSHSAGKNAHCRSPCSLKLSFSSSLSKTAAGKSLS